ncbi:MAG TPA: hypothetical protein VHT30_00565 [Acidimicrobiales bacterium]|jgi:hypothetical protein|nr:hypothetical protein [Acidimicrobiales bacterium]
MTERGRDKLAIAAVTVALVLAACGRTTPSGSAAATPSPDPGVVAADEAAVAAANSQCAAFTPDRRCPFGPVVTSSDGAGGLLYAVALTAISGDACFRGVAYFFDGRRLATDSTRLPPNLPGGVVSLASAAAGQFTVGYGVSLPNSSCADNGSAGTDPYVYGWNGSTMVLRSGTPPTPPKLLVGAG